MSCLRSALAAASLVVTMACGSSTTVTSGGEFPHVTLRSVTSGEDVDLASLAPADRPMLAWFWAPH